MLGVGRAGDETVHPSPESAGADFSRFVEVGVARAS